MAKNADADNVSIVRYTDEVIPPGTYIFRVDNVSYHREEMYEDPDGYYNTAEIWASTEDGKEMYEKFRIDERPSDGKFKVKVKRFEALATTIENMTGLNKPVTTITKKMVEGLRGRFFEATIYHQEYNDVKYPHIDPDSVVPKSSF